LAAQEIDDYALANDMPLELRDAIQQRQFQPETNLSSSRFLLHYSASLIP
jgi:hypothetical protein